MRGMPPIRDAIRDDLPGVAAINTAAAPGVSVLTLKDLEHLQHRATGFWVAGDANEVAAYLIGFADSVEYEGEEFGWFRARAAGFFHIDQIAVAVWARRTDFGRALYAQAASAKFARWPWPGILPGGVWERGGTTSPPSPSRCATFAARW
jgi:predicted GNAT superfamily acetyltransferase